MSAVTVVVEGIAGVSDSVDAVNVIDIAVGVIVDAVARDLIWVSPHIRRKVWMRVQDARVDDQGEE